MRQSQHQLPPVTRPRPDDARSDDADADQNGGNGAGHAADHAQHEPDVHFDAPPTSLIWVLIIIAVVVGSMLALFLVGWLPAHRQEIRLEQEAEQRRNALPRVDVMYPQPGKTHFDIILPGTVDALQETAIFARTNGYLKKWYHDIGDRVPAGALLAEIDAPEIDQQVQQAQAKLEQDQANLPSLWSNFTFQRSTLQRYQDIVATGGATQQQIAEHQSALDAADAAYQSALHQVEADKADLARLSDIQSFQKITAPFPGTITTRNVDVGALIAPGGSAGGQPLFTLAETDKVRVFVNVPQSYVTAVQPGGKASLTVREYPGHSFSGYIARTSGALDMASRTLQTEVDVPNGDYALLRGMYAEVHLDVTQPRPPLIVPTGALLFSAKGTQLAIVQRGQTPTTTPAAADNPEPADGVVHFRDVTVGRDFGTSMEIVDGLGSDDIVITNPGEDLVEGIGVKLITQLGNPPPLQPREVVIAPPPTTLPASQSPPIVAPATLPALTAPAQVIPSRAPALDVAPGGTTHRYYAPQ